MHVGDVKQVINYRPSYRDKVQPQKKTKKKTKTKPGILLKNS